jgi:hypothetical protein
MQSYSQCASITFQTAIPFNLPIQDAMSDKKRQRAENSDSSSPKGSHPMIVARLTSEGVVMMSGSRGPIRVVQRPVVRLSSQDLRKHMSVVAPTTLAVRGVVKPASVLLEGTFQYHGHTIDVHAVVPIDHKMFQKEHDITKFISSTDVPVEWMTFSAS